MKINSIIKSKRRIKVYRTAGLLTNEDILLHTDYLGTDDLESAMRIRAQNLCKYMHVRPELDLRVSNMDEIATFLYGKTLLIDLKLATDVLHNPLGKTYDCPSYYDRKDG